MEKSPASIGAIVRRETNSLTVSEPEQKATLIKGYLEKYALIESRVVTTELLEAYFEALEDFEVRQIEKGLKKYLKEGTRWPWPGALSEYISEEI